MGTSVSSNQDWKYLLVLGLFFPLLLPIGVLVLILSGVYLSVVQGKLSKKQHNG